MHPYNESMTIKINGSSPTIPAAAALAPLAQEQLLHICTVAWPNEACGVLAGTIEHRDDAPDALLLLVTHAYSVQNAAVGSANDRFEFDPASWIQTIYHMQKNRQSLVGYFHSHPQSSPIPSARDLQGIRMAAARDTSYWIISLADSNIQPLIQPYWIQADPTGQLSCRPLVLTEVSI